MSFSASDEALARRLQAEEFASMGLHPAQVSEALQAASSSSSLPHTSLPRPYHSSLPPTTFSYPGVRYASASQYPQPSPTSSPPPSPSSSPAFHPRHPGDHADPAGLSLAHHPHSRSSSSLPLLAQPATTVRRHAIDNLNSPPTHPSHSKRILCLYLAYALAEVVASTSLLALHWSTPCSTPLNVWIVVHTARWALFLPLAVKQRLRGAAGVDADARLKQLAKYLVFAWWVVGVYWLSTADGCGTGSGGGGSALFTYTVVLVVLYGVRLALPVFFVCLLCLCLPCALLLISFLQPKPGASPEAIRSLPTRVYSAPPPPPSDGSSSSTSPLTEAPACAICMEDYKSGDVLRCLSCAGGVVHEFHQQCCDRWLETNGTCPLCRTAISEEGRQEQERQREREREQERLDREKMERDARGIGDEEPENDEAGGGLRRPPREVDVV